MIVDLSDYAIALLNDWPKNLMPVFNQSEAKPKLYTPCT